MITQVDDTVELEAMSKKDSSWRPCQVSLSSDTSTSFGLTVDLGSQDSEQVLVTKEEALKRLRIRSVPLHGDECFNIKEGERLLAGRETQSESLFFDAEVKKVVKVRHSKRSQCRCTFEIKWLYLDQIETVTVPASSIRKLAKHTVDNHPTVGKFLDSVKTYDCSDVSTFSSLFEESVLGFDLEKQIEEIGRFADTSRSRSPEDCLFGFRKDTADLMGQVRHTTLASQGSSIHNPNPSAQNTSKRTTRGQRKVQVEAEKIPPPSQPVISEPDRTHLSPLGARAALASLMYNLPSDSEFSASKLTSTISLDPTSKYLDPDFSIHNKKSINTSLLSNVGAYVDPFELARSEVRASERRDAADKFLQGTVQLNRSAKPVWAPNATEDMGSEVVSVQRSSAQSQSGRKLGIPRSANRSTRSTIQKGSSLSNDEVELESSPEGTELRVPIRTPRLTRSSIQTEIKSVTVDASEGMQKRKLAHNIDSRLTRQTKQKGLGLSNDETELKTSSEEMNIISPTSKPRLTRSTIQKETGNGAVGVNNGANPDSRLTRTNQKSVGHSNGGIETQFPSGEAVLTNSTKKTRLTRSAKQKGAQNMIAEVDNGREESELTQQAHSDFSKEDHVTPQTRETRRKKPLISSDEGINLLLPPDSSKKQRISNEGGTLNASANNPAASSSAKPAVRSTPRLTRSQKKLV